MVAKKTSGGSSLSKTIGRKAAKKVSRKKKSRSTNKVYEVEFILDHVRDYKKRHGLPGKHVETSSTVQGCSEIKKFEKPKEARNSKLRSSTRNTRENSIITSEGVHEVEKILDHVKYSDAFQQFYKNGDERYESIFTIVADDNENEQDRYYFLVKWKKFSKEKSTWESESNCGSIACLKKYKELHGLPRECVKIRKDLTLEEFINDEKASCSIPQSSTQTSRAELNVTSEDGTYEVERIISHVTFEHAYREFFINKDRRFGKVFENWTQKNRINHDKYLFMIKWKNYIDKETTWETETNCASIGNLSAYKRINGLPEKCVKVKGKPCPLIPGNLIIEEYEKTEPSYSEPHSYGFYPYEWKYNKAYGMVRCRDVKCLKRITNSKEVVSIMMNKDQKCVLVERNMGKCNVSETESKNFEIWQQKVQEQDRSYLSSVIQHPNSVKMLDYFFKFPQNAENTIYCYVYEHFEDDLEKKIRSRTMTIQKTKKLCFDMLSILSLLHQYGVHHNVSKKCIFVDGDVYKLSNFEHFQFYNKSGLDEDATMFDIHALGLVLLESLTNDSIENHGVTMEETVKHKLARLSDLDRSMVSMMLNGRKYIDEKKVPSLRFSAKSLLQHPWLDTRQTFKTVKCAFLASYHSQPVEEFLFYQDQDLVETVLNCIKCLYSNSESLEYQMIFTDDFDSGTSWLQCIKSNYIFGDQLREWKGWKLVIVPILKASYTKPVKHQSMSFVHFKMEFGSVPIVIRSAPMTDPAVCRTVIEHSLSVTHRKLRLNIRRLIPKHGRFPNLEYEMCPRSFIDENLEHKFPQLMGGNEYAISDFFQKYRISTSIHSDLERIQPEAAEADEEFKICEFRMKFEKLTIPRRSRFASFAKKFEEADDVSLEE